MTLRALVAGTGQWARRALVPGLSALPDLELEAAVGASLDDALRFAAELAISRSCSSATIWSWSTTSRPGSRSCSAVR